MAFTIGQQAAFDKIIELLKAGCKRIVLGGLAGTGKTYLVAELVKYLRENRGIIPNRRNGRIYVTAPTNKALAVLMNKIKSDVEFKTIHSALKLTRRIDSKTGQESYVRSKGGRVNYEDFDSAMCGFIDESSMLGRDFIGHTSSQGYIEGWLESYDFPIIFIGDPNQLNPVGEEDSPAFNKGYETVMLTEIVRQGAGNPIIDLSRDMDMLYFKVPRVIEGRGYLYSDDRNAIINDLAEVNGTDELKYLAYTNNEVDALNTFVRQRRYGTPAKIEDKETIVFNSPYGTYYTNKEVKVEQAAIITDYIQIPKYATKFDRTNCPVNEVDRIKMKYYRINDSFNVIHEHSEQIFKTISLTLKQNCKKYGWDWRGFYFFTEQFADIKYNHAITVHKSQGSTYKDTIINIGDLSKCFKVPEKKRLLYTAITRASNLIVFNNVK